MCRILRKKFANSGLCRLVLLVADNEDAKVTLVDEADAGVAVVDVVEDAGDAGAVVEKETSKNDVVFAVAALII